MWCENFSSSTGIFHNFIVSIDLFEWVIAISILFYDVGSLGSSSNARGPPPPPGLGRPAPAIPNRPGGGAPPMPPGRPAGQGLPAPLIPT